LPAQRAVPGVQVRVSHAPSKQVQPKSLPAQSAVSAQTSTVAEAPSASHVTTALPSQVMVSGAHGVDTHYRDLATSPDGSRGLVIGERWERIAVGGQVAPPVTAHGAWSVGAIANDGRVVLAKGREGLVLDGTDEPVCAWSATAAVLDLAFTPSGQAFVAAHANGWLSVVDTATCGVLSELPAHTDRVAAVAVSAEGGSVVSASWDGTVRVASLSMALEEDPRSDAALSAWREGR
jgi:WD40 repeat protein